jgi:hypothetical protein
MTTRFRVVVPFRDRESGATREVTITLTRAATLDCMHEAARRGMHPTRDGWPPLEKAIAIRSASLKLGGGQRWDEINGLWWYTYPPGLEVINDKVRRAPELQVIG